MKDQTLADAVNAERRHIIGKLLEKVGIYRLAGQDSIANAIDVLAMEIEVEPTLRQLREQAK